MTEKYRPPIAEIRKGLEEPQKLLPVLPVAYDVLADANEIADKAFGGDFAHAKKTLDTYEQHAAKCGCGQCRRALEQVRAEIFSQWRMPNEVDPVDQKPLELTDSSVGGA